MCFESRSAQFDDRMNGTHIEVVTCFIIILSSVHRELLAKSVELKAGHLDWIGLAAYIWSNEYLMRDNARRKFNGEGEWSDYYIDRIA